MAELSTGNFRILKFRKYLACKMVAYERALVVIGPTVTIMRGRLGAER